MEYDYSKLRGRIVEKFGSQSKFAEHIKLTQNTVSRKMNSDIGLSRADIMEWCQALDIRKEEIGSYFFTVKV